MPAVVPIVAVATLAVAGAGLYIATTAAKKQQEAQQQVSNNQAAAIAEQQKAEAVRKQAMELDSSRRKRAVIRDQLKSRAIALSVATNQGAELGSALPGAYGGISGQSGVNQLGINQSTDLGGRIFGFNAAAGENYRQAALAGGQVAQYQGLSSLGGMLLSNSSTIAQIGGFFAPKAA